MTPTPRAALALAGLGLLATLLPPALTISALAGWLAATVLDALTVRRAPKVRRRLPATLSRGVPAGLELEIRPARPRVRLRQPATPDLRVADPRADGDLTTTVVARRRGHHVVPEAGSRSEGPLRLGAWHHRPVGPGEVRVYPDLRTARRLALGVREGRFRDPGRATRGPLGLGTDFESIREYVPDDDIRQVNWAATARVGRPMSNQFRIEQDRDVLCLVDAGRLMAAPVGSDDGESVVLTRLDAAIDAAAAVALVADELEDRCGTLAFDSDVRRRLPPRRHGGAAVVRALHDVEPTPRDSDYERAFRLAAAGKRTLVLVLTDLLDEAAARSLIAAVPVLARRHVVLVASCSDPDVTGLATAEPDSVGDIHAMAVALELLDARSRVGARLRRAGAQVLEASPGRLPAACVAAYLESKRLARL